MKLLDMLRSSHANRASHKTGNVGAPFAKLSEMIERAAPLPPAYSLCEYVAALPAKADQKPERRRTPRFSLVVDVRGLPLDEQMRPTGAPFAACCRNLSTGGMCLYHDSRIESPLIYVEIELFELPPMQAVMKIRRQDPADRYFEIGGEFICTSGTAQLTT